MTMSDEAANDEKITKCAVCWGLAMMKSSDGDFTSKRCMCCPICQQWVCHDCAKERHPFDHIAGKTVH